MVDVREIRDGELPAWREIVQVGSGGRAGTVEDYLDWRRQAKDMAWFLAEEDGEALGAALALCGWHTPPGVGRAEVYVLPEARRRGAGFALYKEVARWVGERGCIELESSVREEDPASLAWVERRGFREVGRNSTLVLDLAGAEEPAVDPPDGVEIVSWAERPGVERGMYEVALEAYPDIPGQEDEQLPTFEEWLAADMQGTSDRPEATFVALAGGEVVGYAKLAISSARPGVALHDVTGVRRAWRGRGVAGALKRAEIAWAKRSGFTRLETMNEERNEPIRRLNERYGYRVEPGSITVRAALLGPD